MKKDVRNGDVYLFAINTLPKGAKKLERNPVLKWGEATGHSHRLVGDKWDLFENEGIKYLQVYQPTPIIHEDHKKIIIVPGVYDITSHQERSYNPFNEEVSEVID